MVVFELFGSLGGTVMIATFYGRLQTAAPPGGVARVMAFAGTLLQLAALAGIGLGGVLAQRSVCATP